MKIAVITDIHGSTYWRVAMKMIDQFDKIIFLGDYIEMIGLHIFYLYNLGSTVSFSRANTAKTHS